jgi:hypothetical protein
VTLVQEALLVKSRQRVKSYGEVFTPHHMVEKMLDLVSEDLQSGPGFVDKTFLEPAAGDGNFLVAILGRKLAAIEKTFEPALWPQESLFALASIYGIELLEDNHQEAQALMLEQVVEFQSAHGIECIPASDLYRAAAFLIAKNIVRGNTLTGLDPRGQDIKLSWWVRDVEHPGIVQRQPFTFVSLRERSMFDLAVYEAYAPCPIDRVHNEVMNG